MKLNSVDRRWPREQCRKGGDLSEYKYPVDPRSLQDIEKVESLKEKAIDKGFDDLRDDCTKRICELKGVDHNDHYEKWFAQALEAREQILAEKHGRTQVAGYTRRLYREKGAYKCLEDWAINPDTTEGFDDFTKRGLIQYSAEYIVAANPDHFSAEALKASIIKLQAAGVELP